MNSKVAKYSNILYTLSNKNNLLDKVSSQMALIKHLYKKEPNFRLLFETKRINNETKQNIIRQIFKGFEIVVIEFSCIIIQQKDSLHLINIINKFRSNKAIIKKMADDGHKYVLKHYDRKVLAKKMLLFIRDKI